MAFVNNEEFKIGEWYHTTKILKSLAGYFEVGTKVKLVGESNRGYDLEDEEGNRIIECGFGCIK